MNNLSGKGENEGKVLKGQIVAIGKKRSNDSLYLT